MDKSDIKKEIRIFNRRVLPLLLAIAVFFSFSGCGANGGLVTKMGSESSMEEASEEQTENISENKAASISRREKMETDLSLGRFDISGNSAFYILPGLENSPDAMAVFEVLDYNSLGEFVYYYVTPCYAAPEEIDKYNEKGERCGVNPDLTKVSEPKERTEDYKYDAVVLMAYNPDSGNYRVMYARAYEIDKENEFDPVTQGRPFYYPVDRDERLGDYRSYIVQRAMGCKVANREVYLLMDQGGLVGKLYDVNGEVIGTMTYQTTLNDEIWNKKKLLNEKIKVRSGTDSSAPMNVIVTDIAMTEGFATYLGAKFFLGEDPLDTDSEQISTTYMIYSQAVNEDEGGTPYISVNINAEKQEELWNSLDGQFFSSREEYERASGCSMTDIKKGKYGDDFKDSFSPFIAGSGSGDASVMVHIPDITKIPGTWYDKDYADNIIQSSPLDSAYKQSMGFFFYSNKKGVKRGSGDNDSDFITIMVYLEKMTRLAKKISQAIIADALMKELNTGSDLTTVIKSLSELGWIPLPGEFINDKEYNRSPLDIDSSDYNFASTAFISDHALSVVSSNGIYKTYVSPLDYTAETVDMNAYVHEDGFVEMVPYSMTPSLNRNCYVYDTETADKQIEETEKEEKLSESAVEAVDKLKELLRYSEADREGKKIDWLIRYILGKVNSSIDEEDEVYDEEYDEYEDEDDEDLNDALEDALDDDIDEKLNKKMDEELEDMLKKADELSKEIPEEIREGMLYLCAGFSIQTDTVQGYPLAYKLVFPEGSAVTVDGSGQAETVGGSLDSFNDGVLVNAESTGELHKDNSFLVGYQGVGKMNLLSIYSYGKPVDVTSLYYNDGKDKRTIVVQSTDKGVRFFEKSKEAEKSSLTPEELKKSIGEEAGELLKTNYDSSGKINNEYTALKLGGRGEEAYMLAVGSGPDSKIKKEDFEGFMSYEMLLTSSGYTRDTENRLDEAINEGLEGIAANENEIQEEKEEKEKSSISSNVNINNEMNKRYVGHLTSAKSISIISKDKALICSMQDGTKILDLEHGTVANDMKGSYYRAFQKKGTTEFKIVGFNDTSKNYMDTDIPMAKAYTVDYGKKELERTTIDSFKQMLEQYALDYLHREYRTELNEADEIIVKELTEDEKKESVEAAKIFSPSNKSYDAALLELERKYGIESTAQEINDYVEEIRSKIAGVKPAITKLYELAGAKKLAGDTVKRNEGYWKNLESRMTMAVERESLYDILIEIRLNDEVISTLDAEKAKEYQAYKKVLNPEADRGKVSANDIFRAGSASRNSAEIENDINRQEFRNKVLNDIIDEYVQSVRSKKLLAEEEPELSQLEKRELFNNYLTSLLDMVNPENFVLDDDKAAREFIGLINHGSEKLSGTKLEEMTDRVLQQLSAVDAVWKLEELIISEKIEHGSSYSVYKEWLNEYNERVRTEELKDAQVNVPVETKEDKENEKMALSGTERVSYLRTSNAYRKIIGELKSDAEVRLFLSGRKETWDDYLKYVIKKTGAGVVRNEKGEIEE